MYIRKRFENEGAQDLALRLGCPLCMLLRANGVLSGAWIEMSKDVVLPDGNTCIDNDFPCPVDFAKAEIPERVGYIIKEGDTAESISEEFHLPARLVLSLLKPQGLQAGEGIFLPKREKNMKIVTVSIHTTWRDFENAPAIMLLNNHFARLYPGMKLLIRG